MPSQSVFFVVAFVISQTLAVVLLSFGGTDTLGWLLQGIALAMLGSILSGASLAARDRRLLANVTSVEGRDLLLDWIGVRVGPTATAVRALGGNARALSSLYRVLISDDLLEVRSLPGDAVVLERSLRSTRDVRMGEAIWAGKATPAVIVDLPTSGGRIVQMPFVLHDPANGALSIVSGESLEHRAEALRAAVDRSTAGPADEAVGTRDGRH